MTNDELMQLKQMAEDLSQSLAQLVLDGDGRFLSLAEHNQIVVVPPSEVLRMVTQAERKAHALFMKLDAIPSRKVTTKPKLITHQGSSDA